MEKIKINGIRIPENCRNTLRAEFAIVEVGHDTEISYAILSGEERWGDAVRDDGHSYRGPADVPDIYARKKETRKHFESRIAAITYALNSGVNFSRQMAMGPKMARLTGCYLEKLSEWTCALV